MFKELKSDLPASIVVFFVADPLCLCIALVSWAPLFAGNTEGIAGSYYGRYSKRDVPALK